MLVESVERIPGDAVERAGAVLAEGDSTGHKHEIEGTAQIFERDGTLFVQVVAPGARLVHPEHKAIALGTGCYRVWRQRVYLGKERSGYVVD